MCKAHVYANLIVAGPVAQLCGSAARFNLSEVTQPCPTQLRQLSQNLIPSPRTQLS